MNYNTDRKKYGAVEAIIIINSILFALPWVYSFLTRDGILYNYIMGIFALHFNKPYTFTINSGAYWQLLTSVFLHGGMWHLFFNMYALYIFGKPLEDRWGKVKFLSFYLTTGILANVGSIGFFSLTNASVSMVGASGAVFGILLAFGGYYPDVRLLLFFVIPIKVKWAILLFAGIELFAELTGSMDGIAHMTHLFGFLAGFLYLLIFFKTNPIKEMFFIKKTYYYE